MQLFNACVGSGLRCLEHLGSCSVRDRCEVTGLRGSHGFCLSQQGSQCVPSSCTSHPVQLLQVQQGREEMRMGACLEAGKMEEPLGPMGFSLSCRIPAPLSRALSTLGGLSPKYQLEHISPSKAGTGEITTSMADRQQGWSRAIKTCMEPRRVCTCIMQVAPHLKSMSPAGDIFAFDSIYTINSI